MTTLQRIVNEIKNKMKQIDKIKKILNKEKKEKEEMN